MIGSMPHASHDTPMCTATLASVARVLRRALSQPICIPLRYRPLAGRATASHSDNTAAAALYPGYVTDQPTCIDRHVQN